MALLSQPRSALASSSLRRAARTRRTRRAVAARAEGGDKQRVSFLDLDESAPPAPAPTPASSSAMPPTLDLAFIDEDPKEWWKDEAKRARAQALLEKAEDPVNAFFQIAGFRGGTGERIKWGVLREKVDPAGVTTTEEERVALRAQAAKDLTNIDAAERARRLQVGNIALAGTAALAVYLYATAAPGLLRFALCYFPLSTGLGFRASGKSGL
mmetsp:Transcript_26607/g.87229  ORF Transcript_26607/g.87229 Transcript_26607/m.87229 type:complete len:212 (-) Transcript_26607:418-1053(-)